MSVKVADKFVAMGDFELLDAQDVLVDIKGTPKRLQEAINNGELGGGGTSITVDTSMSSTSTNPVQNKVIKAYVDSKSVDISADSDNAIQTKTDGIYVEKTKISTDDGNALSKKSNGLFVEDLSDKINQINFAQKTVNEGLDYCYCTLGDAISGQTYSINDTFPFTMSKSNNMTCNSSNHSIILKKGKTYRISSDIQCNLTSSNMAISIYNLTKGMNLMSFYKTVNDKSSESAGTAIYTPDLDDEEIIVKIISLTGTAKGISKPTDYSYFIAEEIGRAITIDPLEYVNTKSGIEDTPVGEIIRTIGNKTPKHYLMCDGSTHNIADYPYLAQYFKDTFGAINVFGGDGTTTFGVPDKTTDTWWTPGLVNGVVPSPYAVYVSSVFNTTQHQKELLFDGIISADSCWHSKADGSDTDIWVKFDFGKNTYIQGLRMAARSIDYLSQLPSTFTIEGSYDDVTYTVIKSYSRLPSPTSTNFREHLFDKPVNYRYYKLNHMTSNAKNNSYDYCSIAELEFSKVDNIQYIKAEPTYYMELNQAVYINQYCDVYSTDEKIVGKWVDGKPLYRKSYKVTSSSKSDSSTVLFTYSSDMEIQDIDGCILAPDENILVNFYYNPTNYVCCWSNHKNKQIKMVVGNSDYTSRPTIITILYTKTTDAPNSFDYGMIMNQFAQEALVDVAVTDAEVDKCFE